MAHKPNFMIAIGVGPKRAGGPPPRWQDRAENDERTPSAAPEHEVTETPEQERAEHMTGREGKLSPERALLLPSGARCDNCAYFLADQSACEKVDGRIEPDMVCGVYYEPAQAERAPEGTQKEGTEYDTE